ncbi:hypothetical protein, partial [Pectobacterium carotovorum]|uniref:hypothetical protein n=1 Tax=Pectobacterium carotovorum TaxID=554 RepID=UPI003019A203
GLNDCPSCITIKINKLNKNDKINMITNVHEKQRECTWNREQKTGIYRLTNQWRFFYQLCS